MAALMMPEDLINRKPSSEFISVLNQSVRGPQQLHYHLKNMLTSDQTNTDLDLKVGLDPYVVIPS
jgi:hypothetical protein